MSSPIPPSQPLTSPLSRLRPLSLSDSPDVSHSWRPVDHVHSQVEEAWDRWKTATFNLYPPAAAATIRTLLLRRGARILDIGAGRKALWLIAMAIQ